jgi:uncharacterized protein with FMN-binding domain
MVDKAKKLVLSISILVLFALYTVRAHQHLQSPHSPPVVAQMAATTPAGGFYTEPTLPQNPTPAGSSMAGPALATMAVQPTNTERALLGLSVPTATAPAAALVQATATSPVGAYRDGTYTGSIADANWGNV